MRVLVKQVVDCDADAAWRALHSPQAMAELYGPLVRMTPLDAGPTPVRWESGAEAAVALSLAGVVPLGTQLIHVTDLRRRDADGTEVRVLRDSGIPLSGPLAALDVWDHQLAVCAAPGARGRTLWRERLTIGGRAAPLLWPGLWAAWQWRTARVRALAPSWAHDPG